MRVTCREEGLNIDDMLRRAVQVCREEENGARVLTGCEVLTQGPHARRDVSDDSVLSHKVIRGS